MEGGLQTIKPGKGFLRDLICTQVECTSSFESHPGQFRQTLKHVITKSRSKPGPSGRQISLLAVSGCTVSGSALQLQARGNLEADRDS